MAGLPDIRLHDLRHTCAILLMAQGVHARIVMETWDTARFRCPGHLVARQLGAAGPGCFQDGRNNPSCVAPVVVRMVPRRGDARLAELGTPEPVKRQRAFHCRAETSRFEKERW